jgi:hypothetical protein
MSNFLCFELYKSGIEAWIIRSSPEQSTVASDTSLLSDHEDRGFQIFTATLGECACSEHKEFALYTLPIIEKLPTVSVCYRES